MGRGHSNGEKCSSTSRSASSRAGSSDILYGDATRSEREAQTQDQDILLRKHPYLRLGELAHEEIEYNSEWLPVKREVGIVPPYKVERTPIYYAPAVGSQVELRITKQLIKQVKSEFGDDNELANYLKSEYDAERRRATVPVVNNDGARAAIIAGDPVSNTEALLEDDTFKVSLGTLLTTDQEYTIQRTPKNCGLDSIDNADNYYYFRKPFDQLPKPLQPDTEVVQLPSFDSVVELPLSSELIDSLDDNSADLAQWLRERMKTGEAIIEVNYEEPMEPREIARADGTTSFVSLSDSLVHINIDGDPRGGSIAVYAKDLNLPRCDWQIETGRQYDFE